MGPKPEKQEFQQIIIKCVLHLLIIQTVRDILVSGSSKPILQYLKSRHLFVLADSLEKSYLFAQAFNNDTDLRMALYKMGFMKQLPNLLKQETAAVSSFVDILVKMYLDERSERQVDMPMIESRLIP